MPMRDGGDIEFGVRITADNEVFVNGVRAATDESKKLGAAVRDAGDEADAAGKKHESLTGAVIKGTGAVEILKRAWEEGVQLLREVRDHTEAAQQSQARLEAVLRATNNASGQTAETIGQLAEEMQRLTVFDDSQIKDAAATLLTFDKIAGDTFTRVIKLSADLAATGRGDLQTWITVLGKAGQAPAESFGLVERALGKLDPALKVAIQNAADFNRVAEAQNLLLGEVQRRVGGTAQESYRGLTRQIEGTKKAWDDLLRTMGNEIFSAKSKEASIFEVRAESHGGDLQVARAGDEGRVELHPARHDDFHGHQRGCHEGGHALRHDRRREDAPRGGHRAHAGRRDRDAQRRPGCRAGPGDPRCAARDATPRAGDEGRVR
jgi:hypothetical protein